MNNKSSHPFFALRLSVLMVSFTIFSSLADHSILLKTGRVVTQNDFLQKQNEVPNTNEIYNGYYYRILQFNALPSNQQKQAIELSGVQFLGYIPFNSFFVAVPITFQLQQLSVYNVRTILPIDLNSKLSLRLRENDIPAYAKKGSEVDLIIQYYKNLNYTTVSEELLSKNCSVLGHQDGSQLITIRTNENNWQTIAALPFIKFMQPIDDIPVPDDTKGRSLHRSNVINSDYPMGRHYDGTGVSIALADDGFVGPHIDFTGRITQFTTVTGPSHGDMTSGIAVGSGNLDPKMKGMASGAQIYIYDIGGYPQIVNAAANLATYGTVITSTSYSQGCNNYDLNAQSGDQTMNQLKVVLPVFSAGNNNGSSCGYGAGTQWGNITGGYKQGKNVMAVANLDALEVIDNTSSHGPAEDGRIKPDISANGKDQMSTDENNTYQVGGGTSAACPGMAGITAQLYQAYRELTGQANPEAALIKACLLNSAEDIGVVGPDYFYGYGRVNALRAVKTLEDVHYMSDSVSMGITNTHTITVPPGTSKVRVMVLWNDVEGDPAAARALVNDLNITVTDPSTSVFNPWVLNPAPNASTLDDPAIRSIDSLNNMEQVTINAPSAGTYTISVEGHSVPFGPQKYYLVYQFDQDEIVVTYPNGGEGFVPGESELLRWDAFPGSSGYTIEYSVDSGATWNSVASVGATVRQYNWLIPSNIAAKAILHVSNGTVSGQNPAPFSIIGVPQNITVVWACADSLKLSWNPVTGADGYEVSRLGTYYMDSVGTSSVNSIVLHNLNIGATDWFSVRAKKGGGKGRRTIAIQKLPGLVNCNNAIDAALLSQNPSNGLAYACTTLSNYPLTVVISNIGVPSINNFDISYSLDGGAAITQNISTPISFGNSVNFTFASTLNISAPGNHVLKTWLTYPNDLNHSNDTITSLFVTSPLNAAPISQDFQSAVFPPANWMSLPSNVTYNWAVSPSITGSLGATTTSAWFDNYSYNNPGAEDMLTTELVDISAMTAPELNFDVAYATFQTYEDELRIEISTDCGLTFVPTGYSKKGLVLATVGQNNTDWKPTAASNWRKDAISLTPYLTPGNVLIRFVNINGYGNNLYIDNVNIIDNPLGVNDIESAAAVTVYPNPGNGMFYLLLSDLNQGNTSIEVRDVAGKLVYNNLLSGNKNTGPIGIDLSEKAPGIYLLKATSGEKSEYHKLIKLD